VKFIGAHVENDIRIVRISRWPHLSEETWATDGRKACLQIGWCEFDFVDVWRRLSDSKTSSGRLSVALQKFVDADRLRQLTGILADAT
jgi:hypothetical protein